MFSVSLVFKSNSLKNYLKQRLVDSGDLRPKVFAVSSLLCSWQAWLARDPQLR